MTAGRFPLSDVQRTYFSGRFGFFELGGMGTKVYSEIRLAGDVGRVAERLSDAIAAVVVRHEMLRVVVDPDGWQRVLADVPGYNVVVHDERGNPAGEVAARLAQRAEDACGSNRVRRRAGEHQPELAVPARRRYLLPAADRAGDGSDSFDVPDQRSQGGVLVVEKSPDLWAGQIQMKPRVYEQLDGSLALISSFRPDSMEPGTAERLLVAYRQHLEDLSERGMLTCADPAPPELLGRLRAAWESVLGWPVPDDDLDLSALGIDSFDTTRLLRCSELALGVRLPPRHPGSPRIARQDHRSRRHARRLSVVAARFHTGYRRGWLV